MHQLQKQGKNNKLQWIELTTKINQSVRSEAALSIFPVPSRQGGRDMLKWLFQTMHDGHWSCLLRQALSSFPSPFECGIDCLIVWFGTYSNSLCHLLDLDMLAYFDADIWAVWMILSAPVKIKNTQWNYIHSTFQFNHPCLDTLSLPLDLSPQYIWGQSCPNLSQTMQTIQPW